MNSILKRGRAELHGESLAAAVGLGILSLLADVGFSLLSRLWADLTASKGMGTRRNAKYSLYRSSRTLAIHIRSKFSYLSAYILNLPMSTM